MANLNISDLLAVVTAPFKRGNKSIIQRLQDIVDSSYNRTDDAGGGGGLLLGETSDKAYRGDRGKTAYDHSQAAHAPTDAQKNSDITKAEIEAKLTGDISSHTHDYAASTHNHDGSYSAIGHNHAGVYEPVKGADDNFVTDAQLVKVAAIDQVFTNAEKTKVSNLSGTNSGDQDLSGLMVKANNLSDLANPATARTNLGGTAIGIALYMLANTGAIRFLKINADNTVSVRTAAEMLADIGAQASGTYLVAGNNLNDLGNVATARGNLGGTTIGSALFTLANPSAVRFLRLNADNTVSVRTAAEMVSDLGVSGGDIAYAPTPADVAINNVADVTIATKDLSGIAAGDQIIMEGEFVILNNSTATRVYVITLDFDNVFDIEITTPALATSATLMHPFMFRAVCNVRSTSLAYAVVSIDMQLAAGIASGTDTTMAATHLSGKGWGETASNLTGTLTCNLKIRSANATITQTCRLISFTVRKTSAVG